MLQVKIFVYTFMSNSETESSLQQIKAPYYTSAIIAQHFKTFPFTSWLPHRHTKLHILKIQRCSWIKNSFYWVPQLLIKENEHWYHCIVRRQVLTSGKWSLWFEYIYWPLYLPPVPWKEHWVGAELLRFYLSFTYQPSDMSNLKPLYTNALLSKGRLYQSLFYMFLQ